MGNNAQGFQPSISSWVDGKPQWLRNWYIVRVNFSTAAEFIPLESNSDVFGPITLAKLRANYPKLASLGIDTAGLTSGSSLADIGRRIRRWLRNEDLDLSDFLI